MRTPALPLIERVLFTREQVDARVKQVAAEISDRYRHGNLKLIGVLKGSVFFLSALARELTIPVKVDFRCFDIPDRFVIGCGLDYKQLYRNLDFIAVMKPDQPG